MEELSKHQLAALDDMMDEYQQANWLRNRREFELRNPYREPDHNVGGGKSATNADAEQRTLEAIESDPRIVYLDGLIKAGDATVGALTQAQRDVYNCRYRSPTRVMWVDVPELVHLSRSRIYDYRYSILEGLAKRIGWISSESD